MAASESFLERTFKLSANNTNPRREIVAGLTTFAAMSYVLVVNPSILSATGMDPLGLISVTALAAAIGCFLMAFMANYPIALAPGMGTNAYFAFIIVLGMGIPWQAALGLTFWNGIIFFILSVTGLRAKIIEALPLPIQVGIQAGIGFFILFLGLTSGGLVIDSTATLVTHGKMLNVNAIITIVGLIAMAALLVRKFQGAIITVILGITITGFLIPVGEGTLTSAPQSVISLPQNMGSLVGQLDPLYLFSHFKQALPVLFVLLLLDMFDSIGTLIGIGRRANFMDDEGKMPRIGRALTADAIATVGGAALGTSTTTAYVESAAGVEAGGRTGLTAFVVGCCFVVALFMSPLIAIVPPVATAPALMMVGVLMAFGLRDIDFADFTAAVPAIVTALLIPLMFSIMHGIALGMVLYTCIMLATGKAGQVKLLTYIITLTFILFYLVGE